MEVLRLLRLVELGEIFGEFGVVFLDLGSDCLKLLVSGLLDFGYFLVDFTCVFGDGYVKCLVDESFELCVYVSWNRAGVGRWDDKLAC
jgi:hypothetical protein